MLSWVCPEENVRRGGAAYIWRGYNRYSPYAMLAGFITVLIILMLAISAVVFIFAHDSPDGYGTVDALTCSVINRREWCNYKIGIIDTPRSCDIAQDSGVLVINSTIPLRLDKNWACKLWVCGNCYSDAGRICGWISLGVLCALLLYLGAVGMRKRVCPHDQVIHIAADDSVDDVEEDAGIEGAEINGTKPPEV